MLRFAGVSCSHMSTITPARTPALTKGLVSFGGCDYLGLSKRPEVIEALRTHALEHGVSSSASRTTTGNRPPHDSLERTIANFVRTDAAILLPEGYMANLALCQSLVRTHPIALIDERAHSSVHNAAFAADMKVQTFSHMDPSAARVLIESHREPVAIMTDGVFTADGSVAPSHALLMALRPTDRLVLDDCHALGVLGAQGRGSCEHWKMDDPRIIVTSTLAKGLGCYGGFVAGTRDLVESISSYSSAYICTTPIPPAVACASERALQLVLEEPSLIARLAERSEQLIGGLVRLGFTQPRTTATPIAAIALEDSRMDALAARLAERGLDVPLIRYPGGPAPRYFRVSVSANHTAGQIDNLLACLEAEVSVARS